MFRTHLQNGVRICSSTNPEGEVVLDFPNGTRVMTTWHRLSRIEEVISSLNAAYELVLLRANCRNSCPYVPVEPLARIDETLHALRQPRSERGSDLGYTTSPALPVDAPACSAGSL